MTLTAFCDSCGKKIRVGKEYAGKKVKCLHCGHVLILPKRESFLSDPHAEFNKLSDSKEREQEADDAPVDARDMPEAPAAPNPMPTSSPDVEPVEDGHGDAHVHHGDFVRGLLFGLGFWLAATPFLLITIAFALVLIKLM